VNQIVTTLHDNLVAVVIVLAVVEAVTIVALVSWVRRVNARLRNARSAADRAARMAAMAAPGGIDPEAVLAILRQGVPPTLDNVYAAMRRSERDRPRDR
jgi:hypothetical protein